MDPTPTQITAGRRQRIVIVCLLLLLLAASAIYAGYRVYLNHRIRIKIDQIHKAGLPVTTADLNEWYLMRPSR